MEETPQFAMALEQKQKAIREEYNGKLQEIEKEREQIEQDKAQVDRYKQLLLKQRDIMIALTARLNERDDTIIQLQSENDAMERINQDQEIEVQIKTTRCEELEKVLVEKGIEIPAEPSPKNQFRYDAGKRYLPFSSTNFDDDLFPSETEPRLEFLTADEKVEELHQIIKEKDDELISVGASPDTRIRDLEDKLIQAENEKKSLQATLENKTQKIEQLLKAPAPNQENREQVAGLFEKDIVALGENIKRQIVDNVEGYQGSHIQQDISSMLKLVGVAFQAIRRNGDMSPLKPETNSTLNSIQKFRESAKGTELEKARSPNKRRKPVSALKARTPSNHFA